MKNWFEEVSKNKGPDFMTEYLAMGWCLVELPPGKKAPSGAQASGWNRPANLIRTPDQAARMANPCNVGLVHGASGTAALDIDHTEYFSLVCDALGFPLADWMDAFPSIAGKSERGKLIFDLPAGLILPTHQYKWVINGKPVVIFELRAGDNTHQDVLPPSIHPDTGKPYHWLRTPWDAQQRDIPDELLALWENFATIKPQLDSINPHASDAPKPRPVHRSVSREHGSVIKQFNAANPLTEMLSAQGYVQKGKANRWLPPGSTTGIPGVFVFEGGTHCYAHNGSSMLADGHAHDAFDVFRIYEHNGDFAQAMAAAANDLATESAIERQAQASVDRIVARVAARKKEPEPVCGPPPGLLTVPGTLGKMVDWFNATAKTPQPEFAVQAALALGSVAAGRIYCTDWANFSSLFFLGLAKSGTGKEHIKRCIDDVLDEAQLSELVGQGGYASGPAVISSLLQQPTHISVVDEMGLLLESNRASQNAHGATAMATLMEVFGRADGTMRPKAYQTMFLTDQQQQDLSSKVVRRPALTFFGMSTPETFFGALADSSVQSGFLARFLPVISAADRVVCRPKPMIRPPGAVVEWAHVLRIPPELGELGPSLVNQAGEAHDPIIVALTDEVMAAWDSLKAIEQAKANELDKIGMAALVHRWAEMALRVALIVTLSIDPRRRKIDPQAMTWACNYVQHYGSAFIDTVVKELGRSEFAQNVNTTLELLKRHPDRWLSWREIKRGCRPLQNLKPREQGEVETELKDTDGVAIEIQQGQRGRAAVRYRWVGE